MNPQVTYKPSEEVDFVIVGSGAAGGVLAKELSTAGFKVVVLEQGRWIPPSEFGHDEIAQTQEHALTNNFQRQPQTFRKTPQDKAEKQFSAIYGCCVGGGTVHFTANFWRFHEIDFVERSRRGPMAGTAFADWPITYADLEPYYTKVEWEVGVSGLAGASPFDPYRSKPYPLPPMPVKSSGVIFERAAWKLGLASFPRPHGDPFPTLPGPGGVRPLRALPGFRLRGGSEVQHARERHSRGTTNRPLRNPDAQLRFPGGDRSP